MPYFLAKEIKSSFTELLETCAAPSSAIPLGGSLLTTAISRQHTAPSMGVNYNKRITCSIWNKKSKSQCPVLSLLFYITLIYIHVTLYKTWWFRPKSIANKRLKYTNNEAVNNFQITSNITNNTFDIWNIFHCTRKKSVSKFFAMTYPKRPLPICWMFIIMMVKSFCYLGTNNISKTTKTHAISSFTGHMYGHAYTNL